MLRRNWKAIALSALLAGVTGSASAQIIIGGSGNPSVEVNLEVLESLGREPNLADLLTGGETPSLVAPISQPTAKAQPVFRPYGQSPNAATANVSGVEFKPYRAPQPSKTAKAEKPPAKPAVKPAPQKVAAPKPAKEQVQKTVASASLAEKPASMADELAKSKTLEAIEIGNIQPAYMAVNTAPQAEQAKVEQSVESAQKAELPTAEPVKEQVEKAASAVETAASVIAQPAAVTALAPAVPVTPAARAVIPVSQAPTPIASAVESAAQKAEEVSALKQEISEAQTKAALAASMAEEKAETVSRMVEQAPSALTDSASQKVDETRQAVLSKAPAIVPPPTQMASIGSSVPAPELPKLADADFTITYKGDASAVPATAYARLDALAARLNADERLSLQLMAYADGTESDSYRARRLSLSRAIEVRNYLVGKGVKTARVELRALGIKSDSGVKDRVDAVVVTR